MKRILIFFFLNFTFFLNTVFSEEIKNIIIKGNERVSTETIKMFAEIDKNSSISDENDLDLILKKIYKTDFFKDVSINFENQNLIINVTENPIIDQINIVGIKSSTIKKFVLDNFKLKRRSSFNENSLKDDISNAKITLNNLGYFFSEIDVEVIELDKNIVSVNYNIELGEKGKIKKITFLGNKIFKDKKLKSLIVSEEYQFWKFISGKKYLNINNISFDERLLKNFYLNKGYFNVKINSSYARLIDTNNFELIFNIDSGDKYFFNNLVLSLPDDFNKENFNKLIDLFQKIKGEKYSINIIDKILIQIENIALQDQYESISTNIRQEIIDNKINLEFIIGEKEKNYIKKINILGNNVTREEVIRNHFEIDEGDPFNEILYNKTLNNLKNLNFFKEVTGEVLSNEDTNLKIINISVQEKPTGEIFAGAGAGTGGGSLTFGVKENNFMGKGILLDSSLNLNSESIKGNFYVNNPNFNNSDKNIYFNLEASELDRLTAFGYKSNKTGFSIGTNFEYFEDLNLGLGFDNYYEKISTDSTASLRQQSQKGNYWDTFLNLSFDLDKRNQKYETSDGYKSSYKVNLPIVSKTNTFTNTFDYKIFSSLYENNVSTASFFMQASNSLTGDDIKLSERLYIPARRLRGFERGKIGPKDGNDFIGGNYALALNFTSTIPQILDTNQNLDLIVFLDAANLWGVDYESSINNNGKLRSSFGIALDWLTAVGPLNFSLSQPISRENTDIIENFRFNLGTTF